MNLLKLKTYIFDVKGYEESLNLIINLANVKYLEWETETGNLAHVRVYYQNGKKDQFVTDLESIEAII